MNETPRPVTEAETVAAIDRIAADPRAPADVTALARGLPQIATMAAPPPPAPEPAAEPDTGGDHAPQEQGSRARPRGGGTAAGKAAEPGGSGSPAGR